MESLNQFSHSKSLLPATDSLNHSLNSAPQSFLFVRAEAEAEAEASDHHEDRQTDRQTGKLPESQRCLPCVACSAPPREALCK